MENILSKTGQVVFAVDLDGVIGDYSEPFQDYRGIVPNTKVIDKINSLYNSGHKIIISTARIELHRKITEDWLSRYGVKYNELFMGKPIADYYIDDKVLSKDEFITKKIVPVSGFIIISWESFLRDILILCGKIPKEIDRIAGVPRKGLIPAVIIATKLRKKIVDYREVGENDLLVDDGILTGASLAKLKTKAKIAVVYVNTNCLHLVDYYGAIVDFEQFDKERKYVLTPWEYPLVEGQVIDSDDNIYGQANQKLFGGLPRTKGIPSTFGDEYLKKENNNE